MEIDFKIVVLLASLLVVYAYAGKKDRIGEAAPIVSGINQDSVQINFEGVYKTGLVLVYFFPKANTSG